MSNPYEVMHNIYKKYWPPEYLPNVIYWEAERQAFHISLILSAMGNKVTVVDVGGGWGAFSAGCAAFGMKTIHIDSYKEDGFFNLDDPRHKMLEAHGVTVINKDAVHERLDMPPASVDVFTTFDAMEHFHHSPKALFAEIIETLVPGGLFILGVPNCVNLRKRLSSPGVRQMAFYD